MSDTPARTTVERGPRRPPIRDSLMPLRRFAVAYLLATAVGASAWWALLLMWPAARGPFLANSAPDATLLAFAVADGALFVGTAGGCAVGVWKRRPWAWPLLCVHAGAAGYAALYCWTLTAITGGDAWLGAVMMTPSLVVPGWLVVRLRPRG